MRVVSLAPSVTATLSAMDARELLVGVTDHCSLEGDEAAAPPRLGGWLTPDLDRVVDRDPDLVCTCDPLQREVRDALGERGVDVFHREPATLEDALDGFAALGEAMNRPVAGAELTRDAARRLTGVRAAVADRDRPTVYCEEWGDPPMAGGNWVPEVVTAAGGEYPFCDPGERSGPVDREAVVDADPDYVVLHHCGRGESVDPAAFRERGWAPDAVVHVLDDSLLNQPGPRLVDGVERLAGILHGVGVAEHTDGGQP